MSLFECLSPLVGLFALMVRHSIPLPCKQGARVDLLHVMADIGDMQTVSDDLSTFSGHLVVCRKMLEQVKKFSESTVSQQVNKYSYQQTAF